MKTIDDYQVGDIILIRHKGLIPRIIRFFMDKYRKKLHLPKMTLYNHSMTVVFKEEKKLIADSSKDGVGIKDTLDRYINNPNCLHLSWKKPLSNNEKLTWSKIAVGFDNANIKYDLRNFLDNIIFISLGIWIGKKGDQSVVRQYCSEFVAILMDKVRGTWKGETWNKNFIDIQICEELKVEE